MRKQSKNRVLYYSGYGLNGKTYVLVAKFTQNGCLESVKDITKHTQLMNKTKQCTGKCDNEE